jgi:hypothetical protein
VVEDKNDGSINTSPKVTPLSIYRMNWWWRPPNKKKHFTSLSLSLSQVAKGQRAKAKKANIECMMGRQKAKGAQETRGARWYVQMQLAQVARAPARKDI